jgi:HSP20 family protein
MKKHLFPTRLRRLDPANFFSELENSFDEAFDNWHGPSVNVSATDDGHLIEVAAPGFNKDDFNVEVDGDQLSIYADYKNQEVDEGKNYVRKEFSHSSFKRTFTLPEGISLSKISAAYNDGILQVTVPGKIQEPVKKSKKITIK